MSYIKAEFAEYMRSWRKTSPAYTAQKQTPKWKWEAWKRNLSRYGVTVDWVGEKFLERYGQCAICGQDIYYNVWGTSKDKMFSIHIDHSHATGKPRGLLCQNCNIALGKFQDNPNVIIAAFQYVTAYDEQ